MPARAYWKGHLRLSLVTIGVELYSAVERSSQLALHQIHEPSGKRVRYQKIVPGIGPVDTDDIVKGFETDQDEYVLLEPDELDEIKLESRQTIDLVQFVEQCEIDPRYFDRPYYVIPIDSEVAAQGFTVIRDALRQAKKTALGQLATRGRDHIVAIRPCGDGLLLETLRYADEIRASDRIFEHIPEVDVDDEMLDLANELIDRKAGDFDATVFKSKYAAALRDLVAEKRKSGSIARHADDDRPSGGEVVDLMEALKKSVAAGKKTRKASGNGRSKKTSGKKRAAG
jgi:DNA end-binding protein Ku